jgi:hypothetical protein
VYLAFISENAFGLTFTFSACLHSMGNINNFIQLVYLFIYFETSLTLIWKLSVFTFFVFPQSLQVDAWKIIWNYPVSQWAGVVKSVLCDYELDNRGSIPGRAKGFFLASASIPVLGPTQPLIQWVRGFLFPGVKCSRGVTLTTHLHLVPRLMSRSFTSSPLKHLHGV